MQPFKYGMVVGGENFCPRPELERQLQEYARSGQNLVIQGARRMGKTSIIRHAIGGMRGMKLVYADLYFIRSQSDFCARVMHGISRASSEMSFLKKAMGFVHRLRPVLGLDPADGSFTISVDARAAEEPDSLDAVMDMLEKIAGDGKTCVVFDEFQDILNVPDSDQVLARMRSTIQFQQDTPYFFTGSVRNLMMDIFSNPDKPFFKSALPFAVEEIDRADFAKFISGRFRAGDRKISMATIAKVMDCADGISGDVQELCDALWTVTAPAEDVTDAHIPAALELIFSRESKGYGMIAESLTSGQSVVLRTLAESGDLRVYSAAFTSRTALAPSSVRRIVTKLVSSRILYVRDGIYRFHDPFFREWLKRRM